MIDKNIIITTKDKLLLLCEDMFNTGASGQFNSLTERLFEQSVKEALNGDD